MGEYYKQKYAQYLASDAWKSLRSLARDRAGNKCEFCSGSPDHVHHVKYPKRYEDDHLDNLVVACESCHSKLHGIRDGEELCAQFFVEPTAIGIFDGTAMVKLSIKPFPPSTQIISQLSRKDVTAQEHIRSQWPEAFRLDRETEIEAPLTHHIFGYPELADQLFDWLVLLSVQDRWLTPDELMKGFFQWISPGPSILRCEPPSHE